VRYLREFGWHPEVVCATPLPDAALDESLQKSLPSDVPVHLVSSLEPGRFADSWDRPGQKIIRNLFRTFDFFLVPDDHVGWVRPAVRQCMALHRARRFDALLTTGPPFSTHLVGTQLRRRWGLPWIADFRDDWTGFNDTLRGGAQRRRPAFERRLEEEVLRTADVVLTINDPLRASILQRGVARVVEVIPNGFDPHDFQHPGPNGASEERSFTICHAGSLYEQRSPAVFLEGLRRFRAATGAKVKVRFFGRVVGPVPQLLASSDLAELIEYRGIVPHAESVRAMQESDALLLIIDQVHQAEQIWTGKVFEYLGARRPILGLMPTDGSLARILREDSSAHRILPPDDADGVARTLAAWVDAGPLRTPLEAGVGSRFRADVLTERLARLLDDAVAVRQPAAQLYPPKLDPVAKRN
jgi:glycosyltransferase involved in cell wall biosynthesis